MLCIAYMYLRSPFPEPQGVMGDDLDLCCCFEICFGNCDNCDCNCDDGDCCQCPGDCCHCDCDDACGSCQRACADALCSWACCYACTDTLDPALDVADLDNMMEERRRRRDRQHEEEEEEQEEEGARGTNSCSEQEPLSPNALGDVAFVSDSNTQGRAVTRQPGSSNANLGSNALPPSYEEAISEGLSSP